MAIQMICESCKEKECLKEKCQLYSPRNITPFSLPGSNTVEIKRTDLTYLYAAFEILQDIGKELKFKDLATSQRIMRYTGKGKA